MVMGSGKERGSIMAIKNTTYLLTAEEQIKLNPNWRLKSSTPPRDVELVFLHGRMGTDDSYSCWLNAGRMVEEEPTP